MPKQPCLDCGTPTEANRWGRCPVHAQPHIDADNARRHAKQQSQGKQHKAILAAMKAAIERDRMCMSCGAEDVVLTAHYPLGGYHSDNPDDYVTLCRPCHGREDGGRSHG